jgi:hypothetical protein
MTDPTPGDLVVISCGHGRTAAGVVMDVWDLTEALPRHVAPELVAHVEGFLKERGADRLVWVCPNRDETPDKMVLLPLLRIDGSFYDVAGRRLTLEKVPEARWN